MEFLEGTPLDRLLAAGPLPAQRAIDIAIHVSAALSYAHAKGIVHRDIKPANLFIATGGTTKLTDFGIAQHVGDSGTPACGTPSYASPEQREGSGADERSDIFSLGAVLYEMLTAHPLFSAGGLPKHVRYPQDTPEELKLVIARCVAPNPADRFRSAAELQGALEQLQVSRATARKSRSRLVALAMLGMTLAAAVLWVSFPRASGPRFRSIAVLAFPNLSGDPAQEYLADGMTEAITSDLAESRAFRVTSRTSANDVQRTPGARCEHCPSTQCRCIA